jgi:hypothetical protein
VYGGILTRGKIVPNGIPEGDFNSAYDWNESFNWDQRKTGRDYNKDGVFAVKPRQFEAMSDDPQDRAEDLSPNKDNGSDGELFIWNFDAPSYTPGDEFTTGAVYRTRRRFTQRAFYAGVPVTRSIAWSWRASITNPTGDDLVVQDTTYAEAEDNLLKGDEPTPLPLTANLGASSVAAFEIDSFASPTITVKLTQDSYTGSVTLKANVNADPASIRVYLVLEEPKKSMLGEWGTVVSVIDLGALSVTDKTISGSYPISYNAVTPGEYTLIVIIGDKAQTAATKVKIERE